MVVATLGWTSASDQHMRFNAQGIAFQQTTNQKYSVDLPPVYNPLDREHPRKEEEKILEI